MEAMTTGAARAASAPAAEGARLFLSHAEALTAVKTVHAKAFGCSFIF
jgi:hypothetical protein